MRKQPNVTKNSELNVDPSEIEKFSNIASRWWDLDGEFKPLHQINPLRLDFINLHSGGLFAKSVLDVGCGGGILAESMAKLKASVTAIDMAAASLEVAKLHALESGLNIEYKEQAVEALASEQPHSFDIVTCLEMLEHVPDPSSIVHACAKLVKPGGYVFFSTLNRNTKSYLMAILGAEKLLKLVPDGTHEYNKFIKPSELMQWVRNTPLQAVSTTGLHFNPINQHYFLSDKNIDVNYIVCCQYPE